MKIRKLTVWTINLYCFIIGEENNSFVPVSFRFFLLFSFVIMHDHNQTNYKIKITSNGFSFFRMENGLQKDNADALTQSETSYFRFLFLIICDN